MKSCFQQITQSQKSYRTVNLESYSLVVIVQNSVLVKRKTMCLQNPQRTRKMTWQINGNHQVPQSTQNFAMDSLIGYILTKLESL